jgi:hypothetical protein
MNIPTLLDAIEEAEQFITAAEAAIKRIREDRLALISGSKETAAANRASMDLTRALATMRRSQ